MIRVVALLLALGLALHTSQASAHGLSTAVVRLDEHAEGAFTIGESEPSAVTLHAPSCVRLGALLRCGSRGLAGATITAHAEGDVFVRVSYRDGEVAFRALPAGEAFVVPARERDDGGGAPWGFVRRGVEHLALGYDHLLFLAALVATARGARRLALSVTAFSLAHMTSLALLTSGLVRLPQAPVEACIALSVVVMARAAVGPARSWLARRPELAVAPLGLLHGLGFGAALLDAGLPRERLAASILAFHVGIEAGQLALALALFSALRALGDRRDRWVSWGSVLVGAVGCAITIERALALGT